MKHRARRVLGIVGFPALAVAMACSSNVAGTISLITGYQAADPFAQAPAPTSIQISAIADDGGVTVLAQSALPVSADLALPNQNTSTTASLVAAGFDDAGDTVLWGQTLPIEFSSLEGLTLPMFVQRTGELTPLPSPLAVAPVAPLVTILDDRFLLSIDGPTATDPTTAAASTQLFDLLTWAPFTSAPPLPVAPLALVTVGTQALLINGSNTIWYDFSDTTTSTPTLPSGQTFEGLTGGVTVTDPLTGDGYVVVGASPSATPSSVILYVNAEEQIAGSQSLLLAQLSTPRSGAATTWVGRQLFVAGGSLQGVGVELLEAGSTQGTEQPGYAPDATVGAGATALDQTHVLLAGGTLNGKDAGARVFAVSCPVSGCLPTPWNAPIDPPLVSAQAFTIDPTHAFVVGNDASNNTHAWLLTQSSSTEIKFNVARKGATALALPMPTIIPIVPGVTPTYPVAVVGGDVTVESFPPFAP